MADFDKAELIRRLLVELGLTATSLDTKPVPAVAEHMPRVLAAASDWQLKTCATHWRRAETSFGERKIDEISASDVLALQRQGVRANILRANSRGGRHAGENAVRARAPSIQLPGVLRAAERVFPERSVDRRRRVVILVVIRSSGQMYAWRVADL